MVSQYLFIHSKAIGHLDLANMPRCILQTEEIVTENYGAIGHLGMVKSDTAICGNTFL